MRHAILSATLIGLATGPLTGQSLYFPPIGPGAWDTISPASLGWCPDRIDSLIDFVGSRNSKAFIILQDGKIVIEHYYGTFTQDSLWYWASAGKTLTAMLTGIAPKRLYRLRCVCHIWWAKSSLRSSATRMNSRTASPSRPST